MPPPSARLIASESGGSHGIVHYGLEPGDDEFRNILFRMFQALETDSMGVESVS
jgi:hypothetical protein